MTTIRHMKNGYQLESSIQLHRPLDEVFRFFSDPRNLEAITPPFIRFRIVAPPPLEIHEDLLIDYALRIRGLRIRWRSAITIWDPPHLFVDTQVQGPFRRWIHEHRFKSLGETTLVEDRVAYGVPGGNMVHRLFVRRDMERIFAYRATALKRELNRVRELI